MSRKCRADAKLRGLVKYACRNRKLAHKTTTDYMNIMRAIVNLAYNVLGTPIDGPADLTEEFLARAVAFWSTHLDPRSIHNKILVARLVLREAGNAELADAKRLRSRDLGTPPGSRDGTNCAITDPAYVELLASAALLPEPGLVPIYMMQFTIGLRRQEGVMAGPSLAEWEQLLLEGKPLPIRHGAKNKRPREVVVPDVAAALAAVREAAAIAATQGGQLIPRASLKSALTRYSYLTGKYLRTKAHCLRYRFAKDLYWHFRSLGLTENESWPLVSMSLGHGPHREALMRNVYLKGIIARKARKPKKAKKAKKARPVKKGNPKPRGVSAALHSPQANQFV